MNIFKLYTNSAKVTIVSSTLFLYLLEFLSIQEIFYKVKKHLEISRSALFLNVGEKIRTPDLLVRSQTLYPAELSPHTAADRNRTGTGIATHGILSPGRLPVPPLRHNQYKID